MPDRFDLMDRAGVLDSLRISSAWCGRVNRPRLDPADLGRLVAGAGWLESMSSELSHLAAGSGVDSSVFDTAPEVTGVSDPVDVVVDRFWAVNEHALSLLRGLGRAEWGRLVPQAIGGEVLVEDLARHVARVSQVSSVDRDWIW